MGYPVINVESETFTDTKCTMKLSQKWYLENGERDQSGVTWFIPLFVNVGGEEVILDFTKSEQEFEFNLQDKNDYVKLNSKGKSMVRVK